MDTLPTEIVVMIMADLPYTALARYRQINRLTYDIYLNNAFWRNKYAGECGPTAQLQLVTDWGDYYRNALTHSYRVVCNTEEGSYNLGSHMLYADCINSIVNFVCDAGIVVGKVTPDYSPPGFWELHLAKGYGKKLPPKQYQRYTYLSLAYRAAIEVVLCSKIHPTSDRSGCSMFGGFYGTECACVLKIEFVVTWDSVTVETAPSL